jgi:hypothetical protein
MIVNLYIFRTDCPSTEEEWKSRSIELCGSQSEYYTCGYRLKNLITDTDCQLVEFCAEEIRWTYFDLYVIDSNGKFFIENQIRIYTNSTKYTKIQNILYCENKRIPITTGQPCTTGKVYLALFICAILVIIVLVSVLIYILRNEIVNLARRIYIKRNGNNETPTDTGKKDKCSTVVFNDTPELGTTERKHGGNDGTLQGINENNDSQNNSLMEVLT